MLTEGIITRTVGLFTCTCGQKKMFLGEQESNSLIASSSYVAFHLHLVLSINIDPNAREAIAGTQQLSIYSETYILKLVACIKLKPFLWLQLF